MGWIIKIKVKNRGLYGEFAKKGFGVILCLLFRHVTTAHPQDGHFTGQTDFVAKRAVALRIKYCMRSYEILDSQHFGVLWSF